mmetsp:Transcript_28886/g.73061  ORF Transcript_28886/g.73061 Transcript_28886/m.73061 type:complete len:218 (+) Transcript_28886:1808-2461(+)
MLCLRFLVTIVVHLLLVLAALGGGRRSRLRLRLGFTLGLGRGRLVFILVAHVHAVFLFQRVQVVARSASGFGFGSGGSLRRLAVLGFTGGFTPGVGRSIHLVFLNGRRAPVAAVRRRVLGADGVVVRIRREDVLVYNFFRSSASGFRFGGCGRLGLSFTLDFRLGRDLGFSLTFSPRSLPTSHSRPGPRCSPVPLSRWWPALCDLVICVFISIRILV